MLYESVYTKVYILKNRNACLININVSSLKLISSFMEEMVPDYILGRKKNLSTKLDS